MIEAMCVPTYLPTYSYALRNNAQIWNGNTFPILRMRHVHGEKSQLTFSIFCVTLKIVFRKLLNSFTLCTTSVRIVCELQPFTFYKYTTPTHTYIHIYCQFVISYWCTSHV